MKAFTIMTLLVISIGASAEKTKSVPCPPAQILNPKAIRNLIEFQQDLEKAAKAYRTTNGRMTNPPPNISERLP